MTSAKCCLCTLSQNERLFSRWERNKKVTNFMKRRKKTDTNSRFRFGSLIVFYFYFYDSLAISLFHIFKTEFQWISFPFINSRNLGMCVTNMILYLNINGIKSAFVWPFFHSLYFVFLLPVAWITVVVVNAYKNLLKVKQQQLIVCGPFDDKDIIWLQMNRISFHISVFAVCESTHRMITAMAIFKNLLLFLMNWFASFP